MGTWTASVRTMVDPHLSPADAAVALRTMPRRYRAALLPVDGPEMEARATTIGARGVSPTDLASDTVRSLVILERALHDVRLSDDPALHPAVLDRSARHWDAGVRETPHSVLAQLDDVCTSFADAIDAVATTDWARTGTTGGRPVDAVTIVREAADTAGENLRSMETLLAALD